MIWLLIHPTLEGDVPVDECPGKVEQQSWKVWQVQIPPHHVECHSPMEEEKNILNCQNGDNNTLPAGTL